MNTINKIFLLLDSRQKNKSFFLIFLMIISSLAELLSLGLLIIILNFFLNINSETQSNFIFLYLHDVKFLKDFMEINFLILSLLIIFTLKIIIMIYVSWSEVSFITEFKENLSNKLFNNFLNRDSFKVLKNNSAEYLKNFTYEIDLTTLFINSIIKIALDFIMLFAITIFLFFFNPLVSATIFLIFTLISILYYFYVKDLIFNWGNNRIKFQKNRIQFINESFSAIRYIKILAREKFFFRKFYLQNKNLSKVNFKISFINIIPRHVLEFFLFLSILLLLFFLSFKNYKSNDIISIISIYTISAFRLIPSLNRIITNVQSARFTFPAFNKIFHEVRIPIATSKKDNEKFYFKKNIFIKINKFSYDTNIKNLFENISIEINRNSKIGIVGPSGSGKSSLINIICGFIRHNGFVKVDGKSIHENLSGWQKNIGYIPQKIFILNATLKENILFGSKKKYKHKDIINVLKKVNLLQFYKKLPLGINTVINQDGFNISGGEIQRIGIARAIINDPEILILDEATSALDTFTENKILNEINLLKKTIIIVSHRISSLVFCDKIYSIQNNKLKYFNGYRDIIKKNFLHNKKYKN
jgi:ABC-type multidrug transport system fused ATPase/permease subunit